MEPPLPLPRTSSQTSVCPPPPPLPETGSGGKPRTPASKQLSTASRQPAEPQFAVLPLAAAYQPSRRKEEARALQNLRRRLQAVRVLQANRAEPIEASCANNNLSPEEIDSRPFLLQKVNGECQGLPERGDIKVILMSFFLSGTILIAMAGPSKILMNRPMSMVLDLSEIRTAWQDSDFITDCLCWHNVYRQRHAASPLTMSSELCYLAQTWANHLAHTNKFYYRNDKDIGQNLFCKPSNGLVQEVSGQEVATYWYSSVRHYDYGNKEPDCSHTNVNAGHFTQMVWASTRLFGIGKARSRSGKLVVVAHYAPPGNVPGAYVDNVPPPCEECPRPPPRFATPSSRLTTPLTPPARGLTAMATSSTTGSSCATSPGS